MAIYSNGNSTNMMLKGLFKTGLLDNKIMSKTDIEGYKRPMLEGKIKAMYHFFSNTCNDLPDYSKVIENLNMPKLLIWGKHDEFLMLDKMKKKVVSNFNLKDENTHLIEAKHFIQEEQPQIINKLILSFLFSELLIIIDKTCPTIEIYMENKNSVNKHHTSGGLATMQHPPLGINTNLVYGIIYFFSYKYFQAYENCFKEYIGQIFSW